jgi:hypothetical protein
MGQDMAQIGLRVKAVDPCAADERVHGGGCPLLIAVSTYEQEVLAPRICASIADNSPIRRNASIVVAVARRTC